MPADKLCKIYAIIICFERLKKKKESWWSLLLTNHSSCCRDVHLIRELDLLATLGHDTLLFSVLWFTCKRHILNDAIAVANLRRFLYHAPMARNIQPCSVQGPQKHQSKQLFRVVCGVGGLFLILGESKLVFMSLNEEVARPNKNLCTNMQFLLKWKNLCVNRDTPDSGIRSWDWNFSGQNSTYHALFPRAWTVYEGNIYFIYPLPDSVRGQDTSF